MPGMSVLFFLDTHTACRLGMVPEAYRIVSLKGKRCFAGTFRMKSRSASLRFGFDR